MIRVLQHLKNSWELFSIEKQHALTTLFFENINKKQSFAINSHEDFTGIMYLIIEHFPTKEDQCLHHLRTLFDHQYCPQSETFSFLKHYFDYLLQGTASLYNTLPIHLRSTPTLGWESIDPEFLQHIFSIQTPTDARQFALLFSTYPVNMCTALLDLWLSPEHFCTQCTKQQITDTKTLFVHGLLCFFEMIQLGIPFKNDVIDRLTQAATSCS